MEVQIEVEKNKVMNVPMVIWLIREFPRGNSPKKINKVLLNIFGDKGTKN